MLNVKIKNFTDNNTGYRGEIKFKFKPTLAYMEDSYGTGHNSDYFDFVGVVGGDSETTSHIYEIGDRIGQIIIMPYPKISFKEVDELSTTERGEGGFGHTGL